MLTFSTYLCKFMIISDYVSRAITYNNDLFLHFELYIYGGKGLGSRRPRAAPAPGVATRRRCLHIAHVLYLRKYVSHYFNKQH